MKHLSNNPKLKTQHFETARFKIAVFPYGEEEIWIQNKGESGIFGTFKIRPSEGHYGFGITINNAAGDRHFCIALKKGKFIHTAFTELTMFNDKGLKKFIHLED